MNFKMKLAVVAALSGLMAAPAFAVTDYDFSANAAAAAGSAAYKYAPEAITMNKVNTTVANQQSGLLANGTVIESVMPYPIDATIKAKLNIRFV